MDMVTLFRDCHALIVRIVENNIKIALEIVIYFVWYGYLSGIGFAFWKIGVSIYSYGKPNVRKGSTGASQPGTKCSIKRRISVMVPCGKGLVGWNIPASPG
jgi:hypothetical protein